MQIFSCIFRVLRCPGHNSVFLSARQSVPAALAPLTDAAGGSILERDGNLRPDETGATEGTPRSYRLSTQKGESIMWSRLLRAGLVVLALSVAAPYCASAQGFGIGLRFTPKVNRSPQKNVYRYHHYYSGFNWGRANSGYWYGGTSRNMNRLMTRPVRRGGR